VQIIVEVEGRSWRLRQRSNIRAGSVLRACAPTAALRRVWRRTAITGAGSVRLSAARYYEWRCAVFLSVLRSDGQLPAALCAALSSRMQRHNRGVFEGKNRFGVTCGVGASF